MSLEQYNHSEPKPSKAKQRQRRKRAYSHRTITVRTIPKNWIAARYFFPIQSIFFALFYKLTLCKFAFIMIFSHRRQVHSVVSITKINRKTKINVDSILERCLLKYSNNHIGFDYWLLWEIVQTKPESKNCVNVATTAIIIFSNIKSNRYST